MGHPFFTGASRSALYDLPTDAAAGPIGIRDGIFGAAHAASTEREFVSLMSHTNAFTPTVDKTFVNVELKPRGAIGAAHASSASVAGAAERGDLTLHLDALTFDQHPHLQELLHLRRVVTFMEALRVQLSMRRTSIMLTCYPGALEFHSLRLFCTASARRSSPAYTRWWRSLLRTLRFI